jgi:hypothetical protein
VGVSLRDADRVGVSGEVLPFPPTPSASIAGRTMQQSVYRRREPERHLPVGAPNIMIVLIDDAGPALPTTFGGEVHTWTRPDHGRVRGTRRPDPRTTQGSLDAGGRQATSLLADFGFMGWSR